jgi:DNA-binding NarL/FixJ family response regulator
MNRIDPNQEVVDQDVLGPQIPTLVPAIATALAANPMRALIVTDDPVVRDSLCARLGPVAVGDARCSDDIARASDTVSATAVLWDLGPDAARESELSRQVSALPVPVVALAPVGTSRTALLGAGVLGVLPREATGEAIASALAVVTHGLRVIDESLLAELDHGQTQPSHETHAQVDGLTHRENEVVQLMAEGLSNKQIADRLGISAHTAKFHVNAVLGKFRASTRTEAVVRAVQHGVVML